MRAFSLAVLAVSLSASPAVRSQQDGSFDAELVFPLDAMHAHGSCIVECPDRGLLVCWFHGSGERKADDVRILGARKPRGAPRWSAPFVMADTPGFPDTNCCMVIDGRERLWLLWPTILAHTWESALMKYKISSSYTGDGPPRWDSMRVLHAKPGDDFAAKVRRAADAYVASIEVPEPLRGVAEIWKRRSVQLAGDKLTRRLGWFTRAHPYVFGSDSLLVGLYSDGFSFSLAARTDDGGDTWRFSDPIVGGGNIQPSFARRADGTLVAYMRDNGPAPKRVLVAESADGGMSWGTVYDHPQLANPGSGLELAELSGGGWICVYNDTEKGRHSLAVSLSDDGGRSWKATRHLERDDTGRGRFHYPSVVQGRDGRLHVSYSYHVPTPDGVRKSIKVATFDRAWVLAGGR